MNFTDQKPFVLDQESFKLFRRDRFFGCALCGHEFAIGDTARWVYANGTPGQQTGNFFVCYSCHESSSTPLLLQRAKEDLARTIRDAKKWGIYGPDWG